MIEPVENEKIEKKEIDWFRKSEGSSTLLHLLQSFNEHLCYPV